VMSLVKAELITNQKAKKILGELEVVQTYYNKLEKALPMFEGTDKHNTLKKEIDMVGSLLPVPMTESEIEDRLAEYIDTYSGGSINQGHAIKTLKAQLGEHNSKAIVQAVRKRTTKGL